MTNQSASALASPLRRARPGLLASTRPELITLADQGIVSAANFAIGVMLVRTLGVASFGEFAAYQIAISVAAGLLYAFVSSPMLTLHPRYSHALPGFVAVANRHYIRLIVPVALLFGLAVFAAGGSSSPGTLLLGLACAGTLLAHGFHDHLRRAAFLLKRPMAALFSDVVRYGSTLVAISALSGEPELSITTVLTIMTASASAAAIVLAVAVQARAPTQARAQAMTRRIARSGKWTLSSAFMSGIADNLFLLGCGWIAGREALAALRVAQQVTGILNPLMLALENVVPARSAAIFRRGGSGRLRAYAFSTGAGTLALGLCLTAAISVFHAEVLDFVYGIAFAEFSLVLQIAAAIFAINIVRYFSAVILRAAGRERQMASVFRKAAVTSLVLFLPLAYLGGSAGAMLGMLVVACMSAGEMTVWAYRVLSAHPECRR